jgi:hypothetical protein
MSRQAFHPTGEDALVPPGVPSDREERIADGVMSHPCRQAFHPTGEERIVVGVMSARAARRSN